MINQVPKHQPNFNKKNCFSLIIVSVLREILLKIKETVKIKSMMLLPSTVNKFSWILCVKLFLVLYLESNKLR